MSEEEIKKQYANGIVNADEVIKSLIDKFKTDKTSVDIQQLQLIAEYLLYKVDKLQKENKKYIDVFNSTEKIMNGQERTKDKLLKENVELQKDNYKLDRENQHFFDRIQDLQKENEELKEDNKKLCAEISDLKELVDKANSQLDLDYVDNNFISKDIIENKIKELEIKYKKHEKEGLSGFVEKLDIGTRIDVLKEVLGE